MPKISVIMSVLNGEKYLREAVESVLQQTFNDFEFLIFDDASTDQTPKILEEFASSDSRIKIFRKDKNMGFKGFVENLNSGLKMAKGKYIARMDADDICHPERFQKQHDFLEKNPKIFLLGTSANHIDENGDTIGEFVAESNPQKLEKIMLKKNFIYHPTIMFRNSDALFYREKLVGCEDYDFHLRLISSGKKIANSSDKLLNYRILQTSISRSNKKMIRWLFIEKAKELYFERLRSGKDSYDDFNEENFLKILEKDYKNTEEDLVFACKTAIKFSDKKIFLTILEKLKTQFPQNNSIKFTVFSKIPESNFHWASKINKLIS